MHLHHAYCINIGHVKNSLSPHAFYRSSCHIGLHNGGIIEKKSKKSYKVLKKSKKMYNVLRSHPKKSNMILKNLKSKNSENHKIQKHPYNILKKSTKNIYKMSWNNPKHYKMSFENTKNIQISIHIIQK